MWLWNSAFYLHGKSKSLQAEKNKFPFGEFTGPWLLLPDKFNCFLTYALTMYKCSNEKSRSFSLIFLTICCKENLLYSRFTYDFTRFLPSRICFPLTASHLILIFPCHKSEFLLHFIWDSQQMGYEPRKIQWVERKDEIIGQKPFRRWNNS